MEETLTGYIPDPLAGREPLHAGADRGIDEVLLGLVVRVRVDNNEGEHSVYALQDLGKLLYVAIVGLGPGYAWLETDALGGTSFRDRMRISCFPVAARASTISKPTPILAD